MLPFSNVNTFGKSLRINVMEASDQMNGKFYHYNNGIREGLIRIYSYIPDDEYDDNVFLLDWIVDSVDNDELDEVQIYINQKMSLTGVLSDGLNEVTREEFYDRFDKMISLAVRRFRKKFS